MRPLETDSQLKSLSINPKEFLFVVGPLVSALGVTYGARGVVVVGSFLMTIGVLTSALPLRFHIIYITYSVVNGMFLHMAL